MFDPWTKRWTGSPLGAALLQSLEPKSYLQIPFGGTSRLAFGSLLIDPPYNHKLEPFENMAPLLRDGGLVAKVA